MLKLCARRMGAAVLILLVLAATVFILQEVSPTDPVRAIVGERANATVVEQAREELGYNDPLPVQYVRYVGRVATGDLGRSAVTRKPVQEDLQVFVPATLELVLTAFMLSLVFGIALGAATAGNWRGSG